MVLNRPDMFLGVAFNADPFDPAAVPTWSDLTARCYRIGSAKRGRQYELDRNQAGSFTAEWHNADEALNPVNAGSPYAPNVVPYRQVLARCMWPNGGTGNLWTPAAQGVDPSFESYTLGATVPWVGPVGVAPVVGNVTPFQGTQDLTYTVAAGSPQGIRVTVPCIPGRQYTSSVYMRQSAANTTRIEIEAGPVGTSTTTTGAYVRLIVTFTATQPAHTVRISSPGTTLPGTVLLDAFQHEPGAAATAFSLSGPMIRNIWTRGYIERWPTAWTDNGFRGISATPAVGPFAILQNADLHTEVRGAIMTKAPAYYWPLQESSGSTQFAEASGNNGPPLQVWTSPAGATTNLAAGAQTAIPGDQGGVGVQFSQTALAVYPASWPGQSLGTGPGFRTTPIAFPSSAAGSSWGATVSAWVKMSYPLLVGSISSMILEVSTAIPSWQLAPASMLAYEDGTLDLLFFGPAPGFVQTFGAAHVLDDGKPHHVVGTTSQTAGGNTTVALYLDGVLYSTATVTTASVGLLTAPVQNVMVGGRNTGVITNAFVNGVVSHAALFNRVLSGGEIADLAAAGTGYTGETSSQRITRYLALGGYTGPATVQAGGSTLGAASVTEGAAVLDACQHVGETEFGNFFESADGAAFTTRFDRYLKTTSSYTFGERADLGEYPYQGDVQFDIDPTLVLNIADVTRNGGTKAHAEDATGTSQKRYGKKNFTRTVDLASDNETQDAATYVVANRKDPTNRVSRITFNPAAVTGLPFGDGTLWPMVLNLEDGTRVTAKRRPKAANAGAGITISGDFFVESIEHHDIDFETGSWLTTVELSPVPRAQPWILQDATYGQLDVTTVLGF